MPSAFPLPDKTDVVDVGRKFSATGQALAFAGNTVLRHLHPGHEKQVARIVALRQTLQATSANPCWAWLPTDSYHMTLFGGANDPERQPGLWPAGVPLDAPIAACHHEMASRLQQTRFTANQPLRVKVRGFFDRGVSLLLEPLNAPENANLWAWRGELSRAMGIVPPDFEQYQFHITLAYLIKPLSEQQRQERDAVMLAFGEELQNNPLVFELGAPQFCTFEDMNHFAVQFELRTQT